MNSPAASPARSWLAPLLLGAIFLVSGCETQPSKPEMEPEPCAADPGSRECVCARDPNSELCACLIDPAREGCACLIDPQRDECKRPPCPEDTARGHTNEARMLLADGQWQAGADRLWCALEADPDYSAARTLKEQLDEDPETYLRRARGADTMTYEVQPNDTLGSIAQQCLGNLNLFVALARLNDKERPSDLVRGERLRIVGAKSCAPAAPPPPPPPPPAPPDDGEALRAAALEAEGSGDLARAYTLATRAADASPDDPTIASDLARIKAKYLAERREEAYKLMEQGRDDEARAIWNLILEIDPTNLEARLALKELGG